MTADALINNNPNELMNLWHSIGDSSKISIISKGQIFLNNSSSNNPLEQWDFVCNALDALRIKRRLHEIETKLFTNSASPDESREFMELRQKLLELKF